jgi:hypothetical protein
MARIATRSLPAPASHLRLHLASRLHRASQAKVASECYLLAITRPLAMIDLEHPFMLEPKWEANALALCRSQHRREEMRATLILKALYPIYARLR